jgi:hypothetical protein
MMLVYASVAVYTTNLRVIQDKLSANSIKVPYSLSEAKKAAQYAEESLVHMIDIYLNPDQDLYYSCIEDKVRMVDPENIRVCESLLREMQTRASLHRFMTMEAFVVMMSGKPYSNDEVTRRVTDVLKVVS